MGISHDEKTREILFRGKRLDNGDWVEGYLFKAKYYMNDIDYYFLFADAEALPENEFLGYVAVAPDTVGQYTGLTDNKGVKIFEGDIVRLHDRNGDWVAKVVFGNPNGFYSWGWQLSYISGEAGYNRDILLWVDMEEVGVTCEVIGNVFDNPELLERNQ